jgi:hypothetical protein
MEFKTMCKKTSIQNRLQAVIDFHEARSEIESFFLGLPYAHALLIRSLITLADPTTGIVSNISYFDLANLLTVAKAPGRKESGTPTKQTIRNYIQSIERECGDYFKVITEGQNLQFLFPELPKMFRALIENRELNTEVTLPQSLENIKKNDILIQQVDTEVNMELNTPNNVVKNRVC